MKYDDLRLKVERDLRTRAERIDQAQAEREQRLKAEIPEMKGVDVQKWGWAIMLTGLVFVAMLWMVLISLAWWWLWPDAPQWFRAGMVVPAIVAAIGLLRTRLGLGLASQFYNAWTRKAD